MFLQNDGDEDEDDGVKQFIYNEDNHSEVSGASKCF